MLRYARLMKKLAKDPMYSTRAAAAQPDLMPSTMRVFHNVKDLEQWVAKQAKPHDGHRARLRLLEEEIEKLKTLNETQTKTIKTLRSEMNVCNKAIVQMRQPYKATSVELEEEGELDDRLDDEEGDEEDAQIAPPPHPDLDRDEEPLYRKPKPVDGVATAKKPPAKSPTGRGVPAGRGDRSAVPYPRARVLETPQYSGASAADSEEDEKSTLEKLEAKIAHQKKVNQLRDELAALTKGQEPANASNKRSRSEDPGAVSLLDPMPDRLGKSSRMAMPGRFTGGSSDIIEDWLFSVENYFEGSNTEPRQKARVGMALLGGEALNLWRSYAMPLHNRGLDCSWEEFRNCLLEIYRNSDKQLESRRALWNLRQVSRVADFVKDLKILVRKAGSPSPTEVDLTNLLYRGLKPDIKAKCEMDPRTTKFWDSFDKLAEYAISLDLAGANGTNGQVARTDRSRPLTKWTERNAKLKAAHVSPKQGAVKKHSSAAPGAKNGAKPGPKTGAKTGPPGPPPCPTCKGTWSKEFKNIKHSKDCTSPAMQKIRAAAQKRYEEKVAAEQAAE
jgi:hypothetical protein